MKCFEITINNEESHFCHPYRKEDNGWINEYLGSNEYKEIHELPIPLVVDNKYEPNDYLVSDITIVSKKALEIIKLVNKNLTAFESQMYYKNEKIWDIYYTIVFPKYETMNFEKSDYTKLISRVSRKEIIHKIKKLVFSENKIQKITDDNFFTMEEKPTRIYCTEVGKKAIEEAGLIGFAFEEVPVE